MAAVLAAASMLGGCGNAASETAQSGTTAQEASVSQGTEDGTEAGTEVAGTGSAKIADGDVTLTIFCDFQTAARAYYSDLGENPVVQKISEDTGLKFEFIHAPVGDDGSYFQQLLASGDLPDLMYTNLFQTTYPGGVEGAISDGVLYNVTDLVEQYAVNFKNLCEESGDPDVQKKIRGDEGNIVKFGTTWLPPTDNNKIFNGLIVRQDWLDKYNLEAPVTLDDYTNVLRTRRTACRFPLPSVNLTRHSFLRTTPLPLHLMFPSRSLTWTMTEMYITAEHKTAIRNF